MILTALQKSTKCNVLGSGMKKWLIGGLVGFALVVVAGSLTRKSVRAEIVIEASPDDVWSVITDPTTYGEWNPIFVAYEGTFAQGNTVSLRMKMGDGDATPVQVLVKDFVPNEWLHQGGGYPVILTYDHNWFLESVPEGTKVTQYEYYTGLYVLAWDPMPARLLYEAGNENLKARLEGTNE